jgi:hypothetical protein
MAEGRRQAEAPLENNPKKIISPFEQSSIEQLIQQLSGGGEVLELCNQLAPRSVTVARTDIDEEELGDKEVEDESEDDENQDGVINIFTFVCGGDGGDRGRGRGGGRGAVVVVVVGVVMVVSVEDMLVVVVVTVVVVGVVLDTMVIDVGVEGVDATSTLTRRCKTTTVPQCFFNRL